MKRMKVKKILAAVLALMMIASLAACGKKADDNNNGDNSLQRVLDAGKLTIGAQTTALDLPACLTLCCIAVIPPLLKGKFYRWQGVLMLALYAGYVVMLVA